MNTPFGVKAVNTLKQELAGRLDVLEQFPIEEELAQEGNLTALLKIALKNEVEASEIAACWMPSTAELSIKLGFARQVGDEARHYRLIHEYLEKRGVALDDFDPLAGGHTPLFAALQSMQHTIKRLAAGQFTREAIAMRRNEMFIRYLEQHGHMDVARIYRDQIQPDETHHHELGCQGLELLLKNNADVTAARAAMERTLSIADEMKKAAQKKTGLKTLPGC